MAKPEPTYKFDLENDFKANNLTTKLITILAGTMKVFSNEWCLTRMPQSVNQQENFFKINCRVGINIARH